jgi:hypothetical protein
MSDLNKAVPMAARVFLRISVARSSDQSCRMVRITYTSPLPWAAGMVPAHCNVTPAWKLYEI